MKTIHEWVEKLTEFERPMDMERVVRDIRREAFERAELEAYRCGDDSKLLADERIRRPLAEKIAERINEVRRKEGSK